MAYLPSLKKMQYLVKLYELQHFGRTAEACFVSQSTLSAGISDLENKLGRTLIERDRQKMVFTKIGVELVHQAKAILSASHQFVATAEKMHQFFDSTLRVGVIPTIAPYVLPQYLKKLSHEHPNLKLLIREDLTDSLLKYLKAGELDFLILALPYPAEAIESVELFTDPLKLVYAKNSKYHAALSQNSLKQLPNNSVLLLEDGHCLKDHTLSTCHLFSNDQINDFSTNSLASVIEMMRYDLGVSFIPDMAIKCGALDGGNSLVVHQQILDEEPYRGIGLAWRETSPFKDEFKKLGRYLLQLHEG